MTQSRPPRFQEIFCDVGVVNEYFKSKLFTFDEMQAKVIIDTLKELGMLNDNEKLGTLLDVGCGCGVATSLMAKYFEHAIGIDVSGNQIKKAHEIGHSDHVEFKTGRGESLPVADRSVDVITSLFSIHFLDIERFVQDCRRVLKPGGVVIVYEEFLSTLTSLEDDKLPPIVDEITELKESLLAFTKAISHINRFLLDNFQALYDSIDWPKKRRIPGKAVTVTKLSATRDYYLGVPLYASLGSTASNPVIRAFQKIKRTWKLEAMEDESMQVRASWDTTVIVLHQ